jgi:glycerate kinase
MDSSGIMQRLPGADLVITGEGKIDKQTAFGKVISEIALLSDQYNIPAIAFCGITEVDDGRPLHLKAVRAITPPGMQIGEAMVRAKELLRKAVVGYFK